MNTSFNPRTHTGCDPILPIGGCTTNMFQSTHPHGVRLLLIIYLVGINMFQSTHPHGVRLEVNTCCIFHDKVSIHAPTRGATWSFVASTMISSCFNPRTHTGCDPESVRVSLTIIRFQSTHPHGVRPASKAKTNGMWKVSIHAPTRGATLNPC